MRLLLHVLELLVFVTRLLCELKFLWFKLFLILLCTYDAYEKKRRYIIDSLCLWFTTDHQSDADQITC